MQKKTKTLERAARRRGPAPFQPTAAQRRDAMLLMAGGIGEAGIAAIFQLSVNCLRKHFADELLHGRARKRGKTCGGLSARPRKGLSPPCAFCSSSTTKPKRGSCTPARMRRSAGNGPRRRCERG